MSRRVARRVNTRPSRARAVVRALLGVLALQSALGLLILVAAHPPRRSPEVRLALEPLPPLAPPPRTVTVAIANPEKPEPATARWIHTPILAYAPTPAYLADLTDGALAAPGVVTAVDRMIPARVPPSPARDGVPAQVARAILPDRTHPAPRGIDSLGERAPVLVAAVVVALVDQLEAGPLALPFDPPRAIAQDGTSTADRLFAGPVQRPALVRVAVARSAPSDADALTVSTRLPVARDETAWSAAMPAPPADLLRPELLPTARPSPAVLLARWLPELDSPASTLPLKTDFVRLVLPLIMQVNEEILRQRERLYALAPDVEAGRPLSEADQRTLAELLQATRLDAWDFDEMVRRLDAVPLSMALAQAGLESGWGRSRPAREDNALFGQMVFAPASLPRVQPFGDLLETVQAYARNLNTHRAYAEFRKRRAALRARGDTLDGHALAPFIQRYSERGPLYVEAIRHLMRINNLSALDATVIDAALDGSLGTMLNTELAAPLPNPDEATAEPALAIEPARITPDAIAAP